MSSNGVAGDRIRAFLERYERLDEERKAIMDDQKEVLAEAKGEGFDTKILKRVLAIRKMDPDQRREEEAVLDLYLASLGEQLVML